MARLASGWFSLDREIIKSDVYQSDKLFKLWVWIIASANFKPTKVIWRGNQRVLKRGQLVCGLQEIAEQIGCTRKTVRKWLDYLHKTKRISREVSPHGSLVTVLNYDEYQKEKKEGPLPGPNNVPNKVSNKVSNGVPLNNNKQPTTNNETTNKVTSGIKPNELIGYYCDLWKEKHTGQKFPTITPKDAGIMKRIARDYGGAARELIKGFFALPDPYLVKSRHPLEFLERRAKEIQAFNATNEHISNDQARQLDKQSSYQQTLLKIEKGEL